MESGYEEGNQGTADGRQADGIPRWNTQTDPETQVERGFARKQVTQNGATGRSQDVAGNRKIAGCGRYRRRTRVVAGRGRSRGDGRGDAGGKCNGKKAVCGALEDGRGDAE
jgi:hypothetical protein